MAATLNSPIPVAAARFRSNTSTGGSTPAEFDVALYKPVHAMSGPLKLTIQLRIDLRPMPPKMIPLAYDADDEPFWTKPWSTRNWQAFLSGAAWQANLWNNKFWLAPPANFQDYDVTIMGSTRVWRPYIKCDLEVDFAPGSKSAHRTIDVASLNTDTIAGTRNSTTFRSHALLYDSLDTVPSLVPWNDTSGGGFLTKYTIAHEIGHAIGLGHIGELRKTPLCQFAIASMQAGLDEHHSGTQGGSNGLYCYGAGQDRTLQSNIMGYGGNNFTVEKRAPLELGDSSSSRPARAFQGTALRSGTRNLVEIGAPRPHAKQKSKDKPAFHPELNFSSTSPRGPVKGV